ncbi:PACE efflux transporter [Campylobacter blaseri]|nr:PACE efflux transporter [Campylobacter blaseri]
MYFIIEKGLFMKLKERVLHSFIFEIFAILITIIFLNFVSKSAMETKVGVSLIISLAAVSWNFIFNLMFDKIFTGERIKRGFGVRVLHASLFELGFLLFTVPFVAFAMDTSFVAAFFINIGITLIILVFAIVYNWVYDRVRLFFVDK